MRSLQTGLIVNLILNFKTNLLTLQRSSEHLWPKFREIDYELLP
jgi:hypothetical protein